MPGFDWILKSSRPTPKIEGEVFLCNRVNNFVKECYSTASITSTSSPVTKPSASNPTYTLDSEINTFVCNNWSSSSGSFQTIFNSSSGGTPTITINSNCMSEQPYEPYTFTVYNYSSSTINYTVLQNQLSAGTQTSTYSINPYTYDTWTISDTPYFQWISNTKIK